MVFSIITLFPKTFHSVFTESIIKRAIDKKIIKINFINLRDFAKDKHKTVDDKPYGGGKGMVMRADIILTSLESINPKPYSILLSASGKKYSQNCSSKLAKKPSLALICGHYEGVDARVEKFVDEVISIGDFVLTGGEIPAMAIVDSVTRLIPGVIHPDSLINESFLTGSPKRKLWGGLEYPQYTRPKNFRGLKIPQILLTGNHKEIEKWRYQESQKRTRKFRPGLLSKP